MDNMTLLIDPESRDLVFDTDGSFKKIYGDDTTVQKQCATRSLRGKRSSSLMRRTALIMRSIVGQSMNDVDDDEIKEVIQGGRVSGPRCVPD